MTRFQKLLEDEPKLDINGEPHLSVAQFAHFSGLRIRTINDLIRNGNRRGKLRAEKHLAKSWIPVTELFSFHFIESGRYGQAFVIDEEGYRRYLLEGFNVHSY